MKIKNIKIKFNEGHLEHVNIVYNSGFPVAGS